VFGISSAIVKFWLILFVNLVIRQKLCKFLCFNQFPLFFHVVVLEFFIKYFSRNDNFLKNQKYPRPNFSCKFGSLVLVFCSFPVFRGENHPKYPYFLQLDLPN
jgi:hypothetical protein